MKRIDPLTLELFIPKRSNQRFANPINKSRFHNNKANELRRTTRSIQLALHHNLKALNEIMVGNNEKEFHKQFLLGKGISFKVLTHFTTIQGNNYKSIYHYTIIPQTNERYKIVRNV